MHTQNRQYVLKSKNLGLQMPDKRVHSVGLELYVNFEYAQVYPTTTQLCVFLKCLWNANE